MFGFGAKPFQRNQINHCFSRTGNEAEPYAEGLDGIMECYKNCISNMSLDGPTYMNPVLRKGMEFA